MNRAILDTSVVIEIIRNNQTVQDRLADFSVIQFTILGLGELYYGAYNSQRVEKHLAECVEIQQKVEILTITPAVAVQYGVIKAQLRKAGLMIPENDIWIAAFSVSDAVPLITYDRHFDRIKNLEVVFLVK